MNPVKNLYRLLVLSYRAFESNRESGSYHKYVNKAAKDIIAKSRTYNDGSIPEKMFLKIQWYMVTHLFMGEMFAELMDRKLTLNEEKRFMYLAPILGFSDILVDDFNYTDEMMLDVLAKNDPDLGQTPAEKMFLLYYIEFHKLLPERLQPILKDYLAKGRKIQSESLKQFDAKTSEEEIKEIVIYKGGISVLLCRGIIEPAISPAEEEAFYELGGLMQMMNDAVDMHKDGLEGIWSTANKKATLEEIAHNLDIQKAKTFSLLKALPYKTHRKANFLFGFYVFVISVFFKLKEYGQKCGKPYDYQRFVALDKKAVRSEPFSLGSFFYCFPKILAFNYGKTEQRFGFKIKF